VGGREGGTALWMARRETWTDIPLKDFYDALGTYLYVEEEGREGGREGMKEGRNGLMDENGGMVCFWSIERHGMNRRNLTLSPSPSLPSSLPHKNNHRSTYGGNEVPEDFSVPFDASLWPERMQGLRLGKYFKKLVTDAVRREGGREGGREGRIAIYTYVAGGMQGLRLDKYFKKLVRDAVRREGREGGREGGRAQTEKELRKDGRYISYSNFNL